MGKGAPHVGFPESSLRKYSDKLVAMGHKVGVVEQMETPAELEERNKLRPKGQKKESAVRREMCEVRTLGTHYVLLTTHHLPLTADSLLLTPYALRLAKGAHARHQPREREGAGNLPALRHRGPGARAARRVLRRRGHGPLHARPVLRRPAEELPAHTARPAAAERGHLRPEPRQPRVVPATPPLRAGEPAQHRLRRDAVLGRRRRRARAGQGELLQGGRGRVARAAARGRGDEAAARARSLRRVRGLPEAAAARQAARAARLDG